MTAVVEEGTAVETKTEEVEVEVLPVDPAAHANDVATLSKQMWAEARRRSWEEAYVKMVTDMNEKLTVKMPVPINQKTMTIHIGVQFPLPEDAPRDESDRRKVFVEGWKALKADENPEAVFAWLKEKGGAFTKELDFYNMSSSNEWTMPKGESK